MPLNDRLDIKLCIPRLQFTLEYALYEDKEFVGFFPLPIPLPPRMYRIQAIDEHVLSKLGILLPTK